MKPKDIRDIIVDKLESLVDENNESLFSEIKKYPEGDFAGTPAATVGYLGGDGEVLDTHSNERTHHFSVGMYYSVRESTEKSEINEKALVLIGEVVQAFDEDKDLGGQVQIVRVIKINSDTTVASGTWRFAEILIDVVVIVPNYEV